MFAAAGLYRDGVPHEAEESFGQFTFYQRRFDLIGERRVALTDDVQNRCFGAAFYHTKRTGILWLQWQSNTLNTDKIAVRGI